MGSSKLVGIVLLVVGVGLLYFGYQSTQSLGNQLSETVTGRFTDQTMWYLIGGAAAAALAGVGFGITLTVLNARGASRLLAVAMAVLTVHHWADIGAGLAELRRVASKLCVVALPFAHTFAAVLAASCALGFGNGIGSGMVMTLGADFSPDVGRAPFLGLWRQLSDTGSTIGPLALAGMTALAGLSAAVIPQRHAPIRRRGVEP